ncbi:MAG: IS630 family transposase [Verrucomicrobia bacterium]|nr:IS630 family transposase [Verrucomicrobiota bacterium]MCH8511749.1 IS630 family transposase [Kiritimatiellia bacterium]
MARKSPRIILDEKEQQVLERRATSRTEAKQVVDRARIILGCAAGEQVKDIAKRCQTRPNTVIKWRQRFAQQGLKGLEDLPRPGAKPVYGESFRNKVLAKLEEPPPRGQAEWDGPSVANAVGGSVHAVWRVLRKEGICLARQRSWCVSTDKQFAAKAADIIGLYLNPPEKALVISVDEKPSIQALERATGYVETDSGKIVRGYKSTYKRHGTLNLFAALQVATGEIKTSQTTLKRREEFLKFMDEIVADAPPEQEIHVILDNYCTHKKCDTWLEKHPNVYFHFTPTSASWLNQVEIWFGIMSRKALRGASFQSVEELGRAINEFIEVYNATAKPFKWRKREVKGTQLRNTIVNLCN